MGKRIEKTLLLIPRPDYKTDKSTLASGSEAASCTVFEKSILVHSGVYTEVEEQEEYINVSRQNGIHSRKTQSGHWQTLGLKVPRGQVANKAACGQWGYKTSLCMLMDLIKGSPQGSKLLINDFMAGVGELGVAAVHARVSQEAKDVGVTVSYWGIEPKNILLDIAKANINTTIGELFLEHRLHVSGLQPVQAPAEVPMLATGGVAGPSKELIMEELAKLSSEPLRQLTIHANGELIIPESADWGPNRVPPVPMTEELKEVLATLQKEFPRPVHVRVDPVPPRVDPVPSPASGGTGNSAIPSPASGGTGNSATPSPIPTAPIPIAHQMGSGTVLADRGELLQAPGCNCELLKEVVVPQENARCLLVRIKDDQHRVVLEATADIAWSASHFIGRGGPGSFSAVEGGHMAPGRKGANAWIFSRGTEWKKDVAYRANGMWVFQGAASAASGAPVMRTLEAIRAEVGDAFVTVYAHTVVNGSRSVRIAPGDKRVVWHPILQSMEADVSAFDMNSLGKFLPSWEVMGEAGIECKGLLRPAFALALEGNQMEPEGKASPRTANPLCLFLKKALKLKKGAIFVL